MFAHGSLVALRSWIQEALIPKAMQKTLITQEGVNTDHGPGPQPDQYPTNPTLHNIKSHEKTDISRWLSLLPNVGKKTTESHSGQELTGLGGWSSRAPWGVDGHARKIRIQKSGNDRSVKNPNGPRNLKRIALRGSTAAECHHQTSSLAAVGSCACLSDGWCPLNFGPRL